MPALAEADLASSGQRIHWVLGRTAWAVHLTGLTPTGAFS